MTFLVLITYQNSKVINLYLNFKAIEIQSFFQTQQASCFKRVKDIIFVLELAVIWTKNALVRTTLRFIKHEEQTYDHVYNILRVFDGWPKFLLVKQRMIISNKLVYTNCFTFWRTTSDMGSLEIRKYQENFKTLLNCCQMFIPPPKMQILSALATISWKINIEIFP